MRWRLRLDGSEGYIQVAASNQPPAADCCLLAAMVRGALIEAASTALEIAIVIEVLFNLIGSRLI
jgi:hypothetical protein